MIGLLVFDHRNDMVFHYHDAAFAERMTAAAQRLSAGCNGDETDGDLGLVLNQLFQPVLASYRVMRHQFGNAYREVSCMDGTALAFRRRGDFLVVAVTNRPLDASHLAGVGRRVLGHICGPAFSLLKRDRTRCAEARQLMSTFLGLRATRQSFAVEALRQAALSDGQRASLQRRLRGAVDGPKSTVAPQLLHVLVMRGGDVVAARSGRGAAELDAGDLLFVAGLTEALCNGDRVVVLEQCVPYTVHLRRLQDDVQVVVLVEVAGLRRLATCICRDANDGTSQAGRIREVRRLALAASHKSWAASLVAWRPQLDANEAALSALERQLERGYETMCLDERLIERALPHVVPLVERIVAEVRASGLDAAELASGPCPLTPLLNVYPGLVHFALVDRRGHRLVAPDLPPAGSDLSLVNVWRMFDTSLEWLREGVRDLLWHDRELCYSHRLWLQHGQDERRERAWNADGDGIPGGYPSVLAGTFYQDLLETAEGGDSDGPWRYLQLFCVHLPTVTAEAARHQARSLVRQLAEHLYPTQLLEDLS